jgi:menaquinone-dependent protoporphyrinogen oxidase
MRTLIVYATKHGCAEKCALKLKEKLAGEVTLVNLNKTNYNHLDDFTAIVVGGSIYAGQIQKRVRQFCETHSAKLREKPLGLFLCCMEAEKAPEQFETAFAPELRNHAVAKGLFGGEFNLETMNFLEKL